MQINWVKVLKSYLHVIVGLFSMTVTNIIKVLNALFKSYSFEYSNYLSIKKFHFGTFMTNYTKINFTFLKIFSIYFFHVNLLFITFAWLSNWREYLGNPFIPTVCYSQLLIDGKRSNIDISNTIKIAFLQI